METKKINVLIVGHGAKVSALGKKLSANPGAGKIYIAPGNNIKSSFYENIDIRENDLTGLLKFAIENDIKLTIPLSKEAVQKDIASFFQTNGQNIFAPPQAAGRIFFDKISEKKFLYKIHAQTSKFGIFNKIAQIKSYLEDAKFPVILSYNSSEDFYDNKTIAATMKTAEDFLDNAFSTGEKEILIEDFVYGKNFVLYFITDGYSAIPLLPAGIDKILKTPSSDILTNGVECFTPDYNISKVVIERLGNIMDNILNSFARKGTPLMGIIGLEGVLVSEDRFFVNGILPFPQNHDAGTVLSLIDDDLLKIFSACINGYFSDEYEKIKESEISTVSKTIFSKEAYKKISGLESIEEENIDFTNIIQKNGEYYTAAGEMFTVTRTGRTITRAKNYLAQDIDEIRF